MYTVNVTGVKFHQIEEILTLCIYIYADNIRFQHQQSKRSCKFAHTLLTTFTKLEQEHLYLWKNYLCACGLHVEWVLKRKKCTMKDFAIKKQVGV